MGMSAITLDMAKQRRALLSSFLDAEAAASMRLSEVDAVRSAVEAACSTQLPSLLHSDAAPLVSLKASWPPWSHVLLQAPSFLRQCALSWARRLQLSWCRG